MNIKDMAYLLLISLFMLFCTSCSKADATSIPFTEQELPDIVMHNASYTLGQPSEDPLTMKAQTITIYNSNKGTILEGVSFTKGQDFYGSCDKATTDKDNTYAQLSGNVVIYQNKDNICIQAQNVTWNKEDQSIYSSGEVLVSYQDNSTIRAIGFSALLSENLYEFSEVLGGTIAQ
ncbi:MAG: LPS export ABC transporter periplasmic protein LptC [Sphaerochaetaceae bacterium]|nr:LPS export ABC transporter periplasmic protein LptC [Sphaerochaetaceae bacterium]